MNLRDILYFDFDKAASLISQIEGGLSRERAESSEDTQDERNIRKYSLLKIINTEFGGIQTEKRAVLETKVLHHDLLVRLEESLKDLELSCYINEAIDINKEESIKNIHSQITRTPYLKVEGWCAFEDFKKLYSTTENFNDLISFIKRCEINSLLNLDEMKQSLKDVELKSGKKSKEYRDALATYKIAEKQAIEQSEMSKLPEWLLRN